MRCIIRFQLIENLFLRPCMGGLRKVHSSARSARSAQQCNPPVRWWSRPVLVCVGMCGIHKMQENRACKSMYKYTCLLLDGWDWPAGADPAPAGRPSGPLHTTKVWNMLLKFLYVNHGLKFCFKSILGAGVVVHRELNCGNFLSVFFLRCEQRGLTLHTENILEHWLYSIGWKLL